MWECLCEVQHDYWFLQSIAFWVGMVQMTMRSWCCSVWPLFMCSNPYRSTQFLGFCFVSTSWWLAVDVVCYYDDGVSPLALFILITSARPIWCGPSVSRIQFASTGLFCECILSGDILCVYVICGNYYLFALIAYFWWCMPMCGEETNRLTTLKGVFVLNCISWIEIFCKQFPSNYNNVKSRRLD